MDNWGWVIIENQLTPTQLPNQLDKTFTEGHQRLNSNAVFSNKLINPSSRFLSGYVLQPIESDLSRTQSITVSMEKQQPK